MGEIVTIRDIASSPVSAKISEELAQGGALLSAPIQDGIDEVCARCIFCLGGAQMMCMGGKKLTPLKNVDYCEIRDGLQTRQ